MKYILLSTSTRLLREASRSNTLSCVMRSTNTCLVYQSHYYSAAHVTPGNDAWDLIALNGFIMAACFERILTSRRSNFLSAARYFANNPLLLFKVGDEVEVHRVVSMKDVQAFAHMSGDSNPIHCDDKFARKTRVGQIIVHGVILNGYCILFMPLITLECLFYCCGNLQTLFSEGALGAIAE